MKVVAVTEFKPADEGDVDANAQLQQAGLVLDDLHKRGILLSVYLRKDQPGTVMIMECGTIDDAHQYVRSLPGVKDDTTDYYLVPLGSEIPPSAFIGTRMASH